MPNHTPIATSEILPEFAIRKIIVSNDKATLLCALRRPRGINYENWIGSSEFNPYIKYYFVAAPKLSERELSRFYYPSLRVEGLYSISGGDNLAMWETVLGPRTQSDVDNNRPNPYNLKGFSSVSLDEILQGQYFIKDPLIAAEDQVPINQSQLDDPEGYNTSFEITIDLLNNPVGDDAEELNILAFSQVDLLKMKEDFGLRVVRPLAEIGSELIYENCLVRSERGQRSNGYLIVPETRNIFFTAEGIPYSGPAHYHSANNPGPNGYVGWMSGPEQGDMRDRELLSVREINNTKVVSRIFLQDAVSPEGMNQSRDRIFSGYNGNPYAEAIEPGFLSFGDEILEVLKTQLGHIATVGEQRSTLYNDRLKQLTVASIKRGNVNLTDTSVDPSDLSWISTTGDRIYHGGIILLKLDDLLSSNSKFGYLYDLHREKDNVDSQNLLNQMILRSRMQDFAVSRKRLTNMAEGNNSVSTAAYETYDPNDEEMVLVRTTAPKSTRSRRQRRRERIEPRIIATKRLDKEELPVAEISEHRPSISSKRKTIIIKDYDLFRRINFGKFEYNIEMTFEDGILNLLEEKRRQFKTDLKAFTEYVEEASRPYLDYTQSGYYSGNQFANGLEDQQLRERSRTTGNYNYSIGDFTDSFKRRSENLRQRSDNIVERYAEVYYVLTAKEQFNARSINVLKKSLLAKNTTLESLEYFLNIVQKLDTRLDNLIETTKLTVKDTLNIGANRRSVSGDAQFPDKLINLKGRANIIATAAPNYSLFVRGAIDRAALATSVLNRPGVADLLSRQPLAPVAAEMFFGLAPTITGPLPSGNTDTGAFSQDVASAFDTFQTRPIVEPLELSTEPEYSDANARMAAAEERSNYGSIISFSGTSLVEDELVKVNNLLSQYRGATLESLVSRAALTPESEIANKQKEDNKFITKELQNSIVESILVSDNSESFKKEVEQKYKETYFNKEALGEVYETVKSTIAMSENVKKAKESATYKDKVLNRKGGKDNKARKQETLTEKTQSLQKKVFTPFVLSDTQGLISSDTIPSSGIIIYKNQSDLFSGSRLTDNVVLIEEETSVETEAAENQSSRSSRGTRQTRSRTSY
jgi:hypothetical protein